MTLKLSIKSHLRIFLSLYLVVHCSMLFSQSPLMTYKMKKELKTAGAIPKNSLWIGSQVSYIQGKSNNFFESLQSSGQAAYDLSPKSKLRVPVMLNVSDVKISSDKDSPNSEVDAKLSQLLNSQQGFNFGIYPYIKVYDKKWDITLHAGGAYKLNRVEADSSNTVALNQARFFVGINFFHESGFTIDFAPVFNMFLDEKAYEEVFKSRSEPLIGVEITSIIPFTKGAGVLLEGIIGNNPSFNVGVVMALSAE